MENTLSLIPQVKKFQGDSYIDDIFWGEGVYGAGDPMFLVKSDPKPEDMVQWRRIGLALVQANIPIHIHTKLHDTINAFLDQIEAINKEHPAENNVRAITCDTARRLPFPSS